MRHHTPLVCWDGGLSNVCPGWPWTVILSISASWRDIGYSLCIPASRYKRCGMKKGVVKFQLKWMLFKLTASLGNKLQKCNHCLHCVTCLQRWSKVPGGPLVHAHLVGQVQRCHCHFQIGTSSQRVIYTSVTACQSMFQAVTSAPPSELQLHRALKG
jgi:hypothetical protein